MDIWRANVEELMSRSGIYIYIRMSIDIYIYIYICVYPDKSHNEDDNI